MKRVMLLFSCFFSFAMGINDAAAQTLIRTSAPGRGVKVNTVVSLTVLAIGSDGKPAEGYTVRWSGDNRSGGPWSEVSDASDGSFENTKQLTTDASGQSTAYAKAVKAPASNRTSVSASISTESTTVIRHFNLHLPGDTWSGFNWMPIFDPDSATFSITEGSPADTGIGRVRATDQDHDRLTYSLTGTDAADFSLNYSTGLLKTSSALDYDTKNQYSVTVTAYDNNGDSHSISVTINVNAAPSFTDGDSTTRSVAENTASGQNIGTPVAATDKNSGDTLTYTLGGDDATSFSIDSTTGQLQTSAALDYETKNSYSVTITASDGNDGSDSINVTINVTDVNDAPTFPENISTTRSVAENTASGTNIGDAFTATDQDNNTITYSLGGKDAASFSIDSTSGQLQTSAALDYETRTSYSATITASDGTLTDTLTVTISVTDVDENRAPEFTDGTITARSVAENTPTNTNIGAAVAATDEDGDTLTYTLSGTDAASFSILSGSGQLQTSAALDYEIKTSYSVTVSVSDSRGGSDSITVTINVTNVDETPANNAPTFTDGTNTTRSIAENTLSGRNIGRTVSATDMDNDTLTYALGGADAASFSILSGSGQLQTSAALDYEAKSSYTVTVAVSDSRGGSDSITVTINVTDVHEIPTNNAPIFTDGTSTIRSVAENTLSGRNIGRAVSATDTDTGDTLTYTLGGRDAAAFSIVSTTGQLQTRAALDYETQASCIVSVSVSDGRDGRDSITVTINVTDVNETPDNKPPVFTDGDTANVTDVNETPEDSENKLPVFTDGDTTTRSVAENTGPGENIGTAVAATDPNSDTLTYTLGGTDAAAFSIISISGQLYTKAALDHETQVSYTVTVSVSDGKGGTDSITVTINVTDVVDETPAGSTNNDPYFTEGDATRRTIAENTASLEKIGTPVVATDEDGDTLIYSLIGMNAASFGIDRSTGQLITYAALDYERKNRYTLTVYVSDGNCGSDTITVTIDITDVNDASINHKMKPFDYEAEGVGKVVFSEWMLSKLNNMPQWIELYNTTDEDINLRGWSIVGRYIDGNENVRLFETHRLRSLIIKAKEAHVIAAYPATMYRGSFSENIRDKTYSLQYGRQLWSGNAILLELQDNRGNPIDRIGNLNENDEIVWKIPSRTRRSTNQDRRISLIRRLKSVESRKYNFRFGMMEFGWFPADEVEKLTESKRSEYYYGMPSDIGTPGYRTEGADPLPVTLSAFTPQIMLYPSDNAQIMGEGRVVLSWITESEIENAGFNIFRSEDKQGPFVKTNASLIQGAGTTSDRSTYQWIDTTAKTGVEYYYRIEDMSFDGISEVLATQRLKGVFTAKNRSLTRWALLKTE